MFLLTVDQESIEPDPDKEPKPEPEEEQEAEDLSCETSSLNEEQGVSEAEALSSEGASSSLFDDEAPSETIAEATEEEADSEVQESELEPGSTEDAPEALHEEEAVVVEAETEAEANADVEPEPKAESEQSQAPVKNTAATVSEDEAYEPVRIRGLKAAKDNGANDSLLFKWETMPAKAAVDEMKDWIISQSQQDAASA